MGSTSLARVPELDPCTGQIIKARPSPARGRQNLLDPARLGPPAHPFNEMQMTSCFFFCYGSVCGRVSLVSIADTAAP